MAEEELTLLRLSLTGFGTTFDVIALVVFVAFAVLYTIAPALGYDSTSRRTLVLGLYALVAFAAVTLVQMLLQYLQIAGLIEPGAFGRGPGPLRNGEGQLSLPFFFGFAMMKMILFVAAMGALVVGLQRLRLRPPPLEDPPPAHKMTQ
jgi:hypothetical protein